MELVEKLQCFLGEFENQVTIEAEKLMEASLPLVTEKLFALFEETGNRLQFEEVYFTRRKFLAVFGLKGLIELEKNGNLEEKTLKKLTEIIAEVCQEECWALAAHVNRKRADWKITVDLFAAETAQTLAELADRLRSQLSLETCSLIEENIERRVFHPYFSSQVGTYGWEKADHNWNAVITGAIGSACLHLMRKDKERLAQCIERVCGSLPYYIGGYAEDGTCMEGLGYFTYGMTFFVNFAQELYDYTEGKMDLLCGEWAGFHKGTVDKRGKMAAFQKKCYFPDGRTISFSDGDSHDKFRVGLSAVLAQRFPESSLPNMNQAAGLLDDSCFRFAALKMDIFETQKYIRQLKENHSVQVGETEEISAFHVLPDAQWCIANGEDGTGMACKGGHNGEPHNHNDVGHFIYEGEGVVFLTDLGAGEYTKDYFGDGRYEILCNNSFSHSLPIIAGEGQCPGKDYGCSRFETKKEAQKGWVSMELSGSYKEGLLNSFQRELEFDLTEGSLKVCDCFTVPNEDTVIVENLATQIKPIIQEHDILLKKDGKAAILSIPEVDMSQVTVKEFDHGNHKGQQEKLYGIQWKVMIREGKGTSHILLSRDRMEDSNAY